MRSSREFFVRVLRRPLKQFETGTPLGRAKKTWSKMGTAAVAYIALLALRLPSFLGGAAPAAAGAGYDLMILLDPYNEGSNNITKIILFCNIH